MDLLELVHPRETRKLPTQRLHDACTLFAQDPNLLRAPYTLKSRVSLEDFRYFVTALQDRPPPITPKNFAGLLRLSDEFGFEDLSARLSDFLRSGDRELRRRVLSLEEVGIVRERQIERLEVAIGDRLVSEAALSGRLDSALARLSVAETSLSDLRSALDLAEVGLPSPDLGPMRAGAPESLLDSVADSLLPFFDPPKASRKIGIVGPTAGKTSFVQRVVHGSFPSNPAPTIGGAFVHWNYHGTDYEMRDIALAEPFWAMTSVCLRNVDSILLFFDITSRESFEEMPSWLERIESYRPKSGVLVIGTKSDLADERQVSTEEGRQFADRQGFGYAEVSAKTGDRVEEAIAQMHRNFLTSQLTLLWRGSRDGFSAEAFHRCCDGRERTLTLIRDTEGNVFGGFAVPGWESPFFSKRKADPSSAGFLFTLKNPHNLPPQKFRLIAGQESSSIKVSSKTCSCFGNDDLFICGGCDANRSHSRGFGSTYENTTGIEGRLVLTGSDTFLVNEIEVFEVELKTGSGY